MGSVSFDLVNDISKGRNTITHYLTDLDSSISFCSQKLEDCPIRYDIEVKVNKVHYHSLYNHYQGKDFRKIGNQKNRGNCLDKNILY